jgi:midasin
LLFVTKLISDDDKPSLYEKKCVALSQIFKQCPDAIKYTVDFFTTNGAPFKKLANLEYSPKQKQQKLESLSAVSDLQLLRCCCDLLNADLNLFKTIWSWSDFVDNYCNGKKRDDEQFYCNKILAQLTNMTSAQLTALNKNISPELIVSAENEHVNPLGNLQQVPENTSSKIIKFDLKNDLLTNIEGVFLPIFDSKNYNFYNECDGSFEKIVKVDTTRINLRSVALGCASGKAICLSGPVGCGKTTLIEYLARKTGHIAPKTQEVQKANEEKTLKLSTKTNEKSKKKRKQVEQETEEFLLMQLQNVSSKNGFLRIQLGDQTDSKMLLGQYR